MHDKKCTVIVEDDFLIAEFLRQLCEELDVEVVGSAPRGDEALRVIQTTRPDYVLMDVRLQGEMDGVEVSLQVHAEMPDIKIIFVTGSNEPPTIARIKTDHPHRILIKPIDRRALQNAFAATEPLDH